MISEDHSPYSKVFLNPLTKGSCNKTTLLIVNPLCYVVEVYVIAWYIVPKNKLTNGGNYVDTY